MALPARHDAIEIYGPGLIMLDRDPAKMRQHQVMLGVRRIGKQRLAVQGDWFEITIGNIPDRTGRIGKRREQGNGAGGGE